MRSPFYFASVLLFHILSSVVTGQYWLSNRFAQNCAGCHAPGRINREVSERRCTLSCQGCHVNPNGGGITNFYGNWAQQRWLRSFRVDFLNANRKRPSPFGQQLYASKEPANDTKRAYSGVAPLVVNSSPNFDESSYDRSDGQEHIVAQSLEQFLERVPNEDPYRQERETVVHGGFHLRYMMMDILGTDPRGLSGITPWLMGVDLGMRARPVPEHFQFVLEGRFLNSPQNRAWDQGFTSESRIRSAYALIDHLPMNSYFMAGIYRPMLGLYDPDHDSLSNVVSGVRQRSVYHAIGIGAAPNVPFLNFNIIRPFTSAGTYESSKGIATSLGGRWVTLGASAVASHWILLTPDSLGRELKKTITTFTIGGALWGFIYNGELLYVTRESEPGTANPGTVFTHQLRYKLWREIYLRGNLASGNTATDLKDGASAEFSLGVQGYLLSGTDVQLMYTRRKKSTTEASQTTEMVTAQVHLFL